MMFPRNVAASMVAALALSALSSGSPAQTAASPAVKEHSGAASDAEIATRVKTALHVDPYFYDNHVDVSMEKGAVVLRGFVFSADDLHNAIRLATKAAGARKVVDNLSIKEGGLH